MRVPAIETEEALVLRLLDDAGVLVHPGYFFDFPEEAFLVLSLLPRPDVFDEAIRRIVADRPGSAGFVSAPRGRERAAVFVPEHEELGHRRASGPRALFEMAAAQRLRRLMLLPLGTMPDGETSPYSATSTLAIDPIYISLDDVIDFTRAGGIDALSARGAECARGSQANRGRFGIARFVAPSTRRSRSRSIVF